MPAVPGVWRLTWLLFMQPLRLHQMLRAWGLEGDKSLVRIWPRRKEPNIRLFLWRMAIILFVVGPLITVTACAGFDAAGLPVSWEDVALAVAGGVAVGVAWGVAGGVAFGVAGGVAFGVALGVAMGVAFGVALGVALGVTWGVAWGVAVGVAFGVAGGVAGGVASDVPWGIAGGIASGIAWGVAMGIVEGVTWGAASGIAWGIISSVTMLRLPSLPVEALLTSIFSALPTGQLPAVSRWLPHRHDDLIRFPLPRLQRFLERLGRVDPALARRRITEAAGTIAQMGPAARALATLTAEDLERAARERLWATLLQGDLPFVGAASALPKDSQLHAFFEAAEDLAALPNSRSQRHRAELLRHAEQRLGGLELELIRANSSDPLRRALPPVVKGWRAIVAEEAARLSREQTERREIPPVFVAGAMLGPERGELFKGRADIARLIDHDLVHPRPGVLVILGQRRIGKSSLLAMLPKLLGSGAKVRVVNIQGLSGDPLRERPDLLFAREVADALGVPPPPPTPTWGPTLDWVRSQEADLARKDQRLLLAIDEFERLEEAMREGLPTDVLDFLRAGGDQLKHIRLLLVGAWPLRRLGSRWSDRLVSATVRRLGRLDAASARELLVRPVADFPDIWPPGAVDRLLTCTRGQPFLVQLVGDLVVRALNARQASAATPDDLDEALATCFSETPYFDEFWNGRDEAEQATLLALASGEGAPDPEALRRLAEEDFVEKVNGAWQITVPLHRDFLGSRFELP